MTTGNIVQSAGIAQQAYSTYSELDSIAAETRINERISRSNERELRRAEGEAIERSQSAVSQVKSQYVAASEEITARTAASGFSVSSPGTVAHRATVADKAVTDMATVRANAMAEAHGYAVRADDVAAQRDTNRVNAADRRGSTLIRGFQRSARFLEE